jgi:trans-2,3-dihydro-3-hydroxyanthranilate isomerase
MSSRQPRLTLPYRLCDVFTATPLQGNQLAVFEDAGALTDAEMQSLAREMNLSETTFVLRRDAVVEREQGLRVRIFTTREELPFAGHPTLGTAAIVHQFFPEYAGCSEITLDLNVGNVIVRFAESQTGFATYGEMTQPDPVFGSLHEAGAVARALGLSSDDLSLEMPIQTVSTGLPFCIVPLRSITALGRLRIPLALADAYLAKSDAKLFYCIAEEDTAQQQWRSRMQFYSGEDPATGSAAGCVIAYLLQHGQVGSEVKVRLRQGVEMGRTSDLFVRAKYENGSVSEVRVGGSTVPVANGLLFLE